MRKMTICIVAVCEGGKHIVAAADRMFTAGPPLNLEFEPPLTKIEKIGDGCVAMAAGNSLYASEIVNRTRQRLGQPTSGRNPKVLEAASLAKGTYTEFRHEKIKEQILDADLGPDFAKFCEKGTSLPNYLQNQPGIYQNILIRTNQFNLGVDLIFAGCDDGGSHIYYLAHPGTLTSFDKLGYHAIGSGGIHAMVTLHLGGQSPKFSLAATLHAVYDAKLAAEVAPGVGQETEMAVICAGEVWECPEPFIETLSKIRDESIQESQPDLERIQKAYDEQRDTSRVVKS